MADIYEVAIGYNNAGALQAFRHSPDSDGLQYFMTTYAASGMAYESGYPYITLRFPSIQSPEAWQYAMDLIGVDMLTRKSRQGTWRLPVNYRLNVWGVFNGIACRETPRHNLCWWESPVVTVKRLVQIG